ncbi:MAG TPA: hypothetical protein VLC46_26065 [Thermoanaerobaculia bacterium]|jgi:hypothetical protein|nr:hypothetical protein [Thermoanaerobaculia bacterium]
MPDDDRNPDLRCDELDYSARIRFPDVIAREYDEIDARRRAAHGDAPERVNDRPPRLTGLALSGGGIRSATFNLGLLQALAKAGKLTLFDYLSTVSGGGYTGGWWSAWLSRNGRKPGDVFPPPENIESQRDDRRALLENEGSKSYAERPQIKDSAISAGKDPIHHLRLFANVMTPRKGLLSADTWRAIAIVGRNISLTWMILLPILLAAIMIGQTWFRLPFDSPDDIDVYDRLNLAILIPGMLFLGSCVAVTFWMVFSRRWETLSDKLAVTVSTLAFLALTVLAWKVLRIDLPKSAWIPPLAFWLVFVALRLGWWKLKRKVTWSDGDFWRNRFVAMQTKTLSYSVFTLVIFLFAGFGSMIFSLLLTGAEHRVAQAGGWSAFALAAVSAVYTALKAAPTGGGDNTKATEKAPLLQRLAFAIGPLLLLLVLGIVLSWIGDQLYQEVYASHRLIKYVIRGALVSASLFLAFALYEFRPQQRWKNLAVIAVWIAAGIAAFTIDPSTFRDHLITIGGVALSLLAAALVLRSILRRLLWIFLYAMVLAATAAWFFTIKTADYVLPDTGVSVFVIIAGIVRVPVFVIIAGIAHSPAYVVAGIARVPVYVIAGIVATLALLLFELIEGKGANSRSIALTVTACTIFVLVGAAAGALGQFGLRALTMVGLISTIIGWVLALGWLADPNSLTMHGFYQARLVRAYMGASNEGRAKVSSADITDAVPGDDVLLTQLRNTERGAPYHLINTTLNLVGGSDLSTQARASDAFLMSKHFCGSVRTGYRPTSEYACGSISLGTAVAVSGAAASPTMGAQSPSAALSALMTLFNIRLGLWAPTPSLSYWRSGAARLWPVYTVQELISQTTDLLPYCYLTDGGHFENTGVYPLIQRGCKLIVVSDCGADPRTMLADLGNLIRKVRIDFGTEVSFKDDDIRKLRAEPPGEHVLVGHVKYGDRHAETLGLSESERLATIVVVKPNLVGDEPLDVKQYGFLNTDFPQQNTFDLWYDEAQFESYRRLGEESGQLAVDTGKIG